LVLIGAKESCLQFEDVRISRDFASIGNRLQNLDTANYGRTEKAGARQGEEIASYVSLVGWDQIANPKFKALLELRLKNPDASYEELAKMLSEELNTEISKSNVNHLFRSLGEEVRKARHENSR
jgi:DNA-binding protein WhiA